MQFFLRFSLIACWVPNFVRSLFDHRRAYFSFCCFNLWLIVCLLRGGSIQFDHGFGVVENNVKEDCMNIRFECVLLHGLGANVISQ